MSPIPSSPESQAATSAAGAEAAALAAPAQAGPALLTRGDAGAEEPAEHRRDTRLDRLLMQLDALVKVRSFRVEDLLALRSGAVVETVHEHSQDVPMECRGTPLVWGEFEVVEQKLGVRITRLA